MDDHVRFTCTTAADASGAARIRIGFSGWLQRHFALGEERLSDLILAVYEALANAAEFGYLGTPDHGTIALTAIYDDDVDTLAVTITDRGRWRPPATSTTPAQRAPRGRGIPLMRALTDETRIDTSERGTQVLPEVDPPAVAVQVSAPRLGGAAPQRSDRHPRPPWLTTQFHETKPPSASSPPCGNTDRHAHV